MYECADFEREADAGESVVRKCMISSAYRKGPAKSSEGLLDEAGFQAERKFTSFEGLLMFVGMWTDYRNLASLAPDSCS